MSRMDWHRLQVNPPVSCYRLPSRVRKNISKMPASTWLLPRPGADNRDHALGDWCNDAPARERINSAVFWHHSRLQITAKKLKNRINIKSSTLKNNGSIWKQLLIYHVARASIGMTTPVIRRMIYLHFAARNTSWRYTGASQASVRFKPVRSMGMIFPVMFANIWISAQFHDISSWKRKVDNFFVPVIFNFYISWTRLMRFPIYS